MLLNEISALRTCILIAFAKTPEKESVYVGNITLEKDGRKFQFDWNEHSGEYIDKTLLRELLRLIEVGASCFNHYYVGYDDT